MAKFLGEVTFYIHHNQMQQASLTSIGEQNSCLIETAKFCFCDRDLRLFSIKLEEKHFSLQTPVEDTCFVKKQYSRTTIHMQQEPFES